MPFNFPDPAVSTTAINPVTGATYQWKADPGKWVLTGGAAEPPTPPVTIDLLPPEDPQIGDLWIHEESLVEYAWDGSQWFEVGSSCNGGKGSGGSAVIIYPMPEGGTPPIENNSGDPIEEGDVWLNTYNGWLSVYDGSDWLPVGERPSVSVGPTPPLWNSSGDIINQYPVTEGDLWFDSEQAALYVAAIDTNGNLVWVISTPADRRILESQVRTNFRFKPAAIDGETFYNPVTDLWYYYNSAKNQWIDLPLDGDRFLHSKLELEWTLDDSFISQGGTSYVNYSDDELTSRISINHIDVNGSDWSTIFKELRVGSEISLMQRYKEYDPINPDIIINERPHVTRYQVQGITLLPDDDTAETINMAVRYLDQDANLPHQFDDNNDVWFIINVALNKYVKKDGDTMTGDLIMEDAKIQFNTDDLNTPYIDFRRPNGEFVRAINFANNDEVSSSLGGYDINLAGFTSYNRLRLTGRNSANNPVMFEARADGTMEFFYNVDFNDKRVTNLGEPVNKGDGTNKEYVDEGDEELRQDIFELKEEINAIAPSIEYGVWEWQNPSNPLRPPAPGTFFLVDASIAGTPVLTNEYAKTTRIVVHNDEFVPSGSTDPVDTHTWVDADVGKLIQLFDSADPDFLLGEITGKTVDSANNHVTLDIQRIQSSGFPNDNPEVETNKYLTRVNIFNAPTGGDASGFVLKTGDTMSGNLAIDRSGGLTDAEAALTLKGNRPNTNNSSATIAFQNAQATNIGYLTYRAFGTTERFFKFNQNVDLSNQGLLSVGQIRMKEGAYIGYVTNPRITIRNGDGSNAATEITRPGDGRRTFSIRGKAASSSSITDFFWAFGNSGSGGDAIHYTGLMTGDTHIVTKGHVDSNHVKGKFTITSSGGNYYIEPTP